MATIETRVRHDTSWWLKHGAIGGLVAGIVFALFEMLMAALIEGASAFWMPMRMIGATVLGEQALQPSYLLLTAAVVGMLVHMMLSVIYGLVFALLVAYAPPLARPAIMLIGAASIYGFVLWVVNFYAIAPLAGWSWFPNQTNPIVQVVAHAVFFGTALGFYLDRVKAS